MGFCLSVCISIFYDIGIFQRHGKVAATAVKTQVIHQLIKAWHINRHTHIYAEFADLFAFCPAPKNYS